MLNNPEQQRQVTPQRQMRERPTEPPCQKRLYLIAQRAVQQQAVQVLLEQNPSVSNQNTL